ncbi:MAG: hypothetical protein V1921_04970 [Candidatus Altiarchaeota archaeon]
MVAPKYRSRSTKKVKRRTPGGRTVTHYKDKKKNLPACGRCGVQITDGGERMYAGLLCVNCTEELIRYGTRFRVKFHYPEHNDLDLRRDLTLEEFLPRGWWERVSSGQKMGRTPKKPFKRKAKKVVEKKKEEKPVKEKRSSKKTSKKKPKKA